MPEPQPERMTEPPMTELPMTEPPTTEPRLEPMPTDWQRALAVVAHPDDLD
jgi:hypothetical protein